MIQLRTLALGVTATLLASTAWAGEQWQANFDDAAKLAKEQNKDLLVDFTGSDWCGWCIKLHDEVFVHDEFLDEAQKHFVLTALDFPRSEEVKAKVPNPERNEELREKYAIRGYPTVLLMTPEGEVYGRTGYQEGGAQAYLEHLDELRTKGKQALADAKGLIQRFESAEGEEQTAVLQEVLATLRQEGDGSAVAGLYVPVAKRAFELDPNNEKGLKLQAVEALVATGHVDQEVTEAGIALDPRNEQGLFQKIVEARADSVASAEDVEEVCALIDRFAALGEIQDKEVATKLYVNAAWWNHQVLEDEQAAKKYAEKAKALVTDNERLIEMLDGILNGD